jgi:hypothetical protein
MTDNQMECPECGEDAVNQPSTDQVPWEAHGLEAPQWSHRDGSSLCPVIGDSGGYEPAQPRQRVAEAPAEAPAGRWDEPEGAVTPRGWLRQGETCVGNYLDYGPDHYRSPHEYCRPDDLCRDCQPGNVHAVRYPDGPGSEPRESGYFETIDQARQFVEHGGQPVAEAEGQAEGVCREPGANGGSCGLEAEHEGRHLPVHVIDQEQPQRQP